jgi:peptidoglycan/xylan/chitin deacetylase (PgdA/CDA1 family)
MRYLITTAVILFLILGVLAGVFTVFFDQAVLVRKGTVYRVPVSEKLVALTFDDGPSPVWTMRILDELKKADVKATFFMLGKHVAEYPLAAQRVAGEGHEIENHGYSHRVLLYYKAKELEDDIRQAEETIKEVTGKTTKYFRPPKAWITGEEKNKLQEMGYQVVLWSLNSKDWVTFHDKHIRRYILHHIRPGDIILFHDSGGVFTTEGGSRRQTVRTIFRLVEQLKEKGYKFVTVDELLQKYAE